MRAALDALQVANSVLAPVCIQNLGHETVQTVGVLLSVELHNEFHDDLHTASMFVKVSLQGKAAHQQMQQIFCQFGVV